MKLFLIIFLGFIAGASTGFFGIGGGIIFVPVIFFLLKSQGVFPADALIVATGTSLGAMIFASVSSGAKYLKLKYTDTKTVIIIIIGFIPASAWGTIIVNKIGGEPLRFLFALFTLWGAYQMFRKGIKSHKSIDNDSGTQKFIREHRISAKDIVILLMLGFVAGISSGMLGLGGGVFIVTGLTALLKYPPGAAVGTSTVIAFFASVAGSIFRATLSESSPNFPPHTLGSLCVPIAILLGIPAAFGAQVGVLLHQKIRPRWFYFAFGTVLIGITIKLLAQ